MTNPQGGYEGNATMSFNAIGSGTQAAKLRVRRLSYAWDVIANESHARRYRAFYPKQRAIAKFAVQVELKGYAEYKLFYSFLRNYIISFVESASQTLDRQALLVSVPVRNFLRYGIPIHGVADGDHVGSNLFSPTVIFESVSDPIDPTIFTPQAGNISRTDMAGVTGDQANFFYPFSAASETIGIKPETLYDFNPSGGGGGSDVGQIPGLPGGSGAGGRRGGGGTF